jgi:hypothetical protein
MFTSEEVWLRQMIWAEYRSGTSEKQASINIIAKFGSKSVSQSIIHDCYMRFKSGDTNLIEQYCIKPAIPIIIT